MEMICIGKSGSNVLRVDNCRQGNLSIKTNIPLGYGAHSRALKLQVGRKVAEYSQGTFPWI